MEHLTHTCLSLFFPQAKDFKFTSGTCQQWRELVLSLSGSCECLVVTEAGDKVSRWAAWKGSETRVFGGVFIKGEGLCSPHPEAGIWIVGRGGGNLLSSSSRTARTPFPSGGHTSPRPTHGPFSLLAGDVLGLPVSGPLFPLLGQQISISIIFQGGAFWGRILGKAKEAFKSLA